MLVLARKTGERICLDGNIAITVLEINGKRARLGIEAPASIPILRGEFGAFASEEPIEKLDRRRTAPT